MKNVVKIACIGLDCHRNFSLASARAESGEIAWRMRLDHADRGKMRKQLGAWPPGTPVILEGTFGWGWMSDELRSAKLDPHLSSGRKVAGWRGARGMAKSNKKDADLLSELWNERPTVRNGVQERWWEVWCAPSEVRDQREWLRYRMSLVRMQTAMKNQVHAALHRHGLVQPYTDLFGVAGRKWLDEVCQEDSSLISKSGRRTLQGRLMMLTQLRRQIAAATREFRSVIRRCPDVKRLTTLPGVSTVLAYTIASEIGRLDRFVNGRRLARYSLLAPISDDSGDERDGPPIGRHVGKAGRRTLKWAWIEAARNAVKKSPRMRKVFDRYTDDGKYNRGRGYIVVAHQMCLIAYAMWKKQTPYQETPPPRPGQVSSTAAPGEPKEIQPSAEEFGALGATSRKGEETKSVEIVRRGKPKRERGSKSSLKESDERKELKRLNNRTLVRERTSPKSAMAARRGGSVATLSRTNRDKAEV